MKKRMISTALLAGVFAFGAVASVQLADYTAYRVDSDVSSSDPSVKINKVETTNPWEGTKGTITVDYTLSELDSRYKYRVAFDVTAKLDPTTVEQAEDGKGLVIPVPATAEKGFMILKSRGTEPSNRSGRPDTADVQHD